MIYEDYVSFEIAKLLKENGFDEYTFSDYSEKGVIEFNEVETRIAKGYQRPTLQMAMKWLRKEKNIFIDIYYEKDITGYMYSIIKLTKGTILNVSDLAYNSYEQACEAAIKYCLEKFNLMNYELATN